MRRDAHHGGRFKSHATPKCWRAYDALPPHVQKLAKQAYRQFREDPSYKALEFSASSGLRTSGP